MELSIAFGAHAWNEGDHAACSRCYVKTAESLCAAFGQADKASKPARPILDDLQSALQRVSKSTDVDENAWIMRYVFDKTEIVVGLQADRSAAMSMLGRQCVLQSGYVNAVDAYGDALVGLHELQGIAIERIPVACRYAPFGLSDALFAQRKYAESAAAIQEGMKFIPDWAEQAGDLRKFFGNTGVYNLLIDDLKHAAEGKPDDPSIQFLYGYHLFFTGRRDEAKPYLERAQKLDARLTASEKILAAPATSKKPDVKKKPSEGLLPKHGDL
jgi:tetratricopeptide (TPR) repeat protein